MIAELAGALLETTLATSAAAFLVLLLRRPLRHVVGARGAYALWLLLPIAGLAVLLPARTLTLALPQEPTVAIAPIQMQAPASIDSPFDAQPWLFAAWGLGAVALAVVLAWQQRRFRRALGRLHTRADGSWQADSVDAGPAVIGLWRGRIVLPADFDSRYSELERELVLRHERVHLARRDPLANLVAAALRCCYWFNPLLHYAVGRFRFDQELAVDAAVLAQRPEARRSYADAMLKTQLMLDPPPLGCHWQSAHPLKERIAMLKHPLPGAARLATGFAFVVLLSAATGYAAWANQPEQVRFEDVSMEKGSVEAHLVRNGKRASGASYSGTVGAKLALNDEDLRLEFSFTKLEPTQVTIASTLYQGGTVLAQPTLVVKRGTRGSFAVGDVRGPDSNPSIGVEFDVPASGGAAIEDVHAARENLEERKVKPPRYPKDAIARRVSGKVVLKVEVSAEGRALQTELDREASTPDVDASLVEAAVEAVRGWNFQPALSDNGQPVSGWVSVPLTFSLSEDKAASALSTPPPRLVSQDEAPSPMPTYRRIVPPKYPKAAIAEKREGKVFLRVLVGVDGVVQQIEVESTSGSADLDESAKATVREWTFNAAHDGTKALPAWIGVPIDFQLTEKSPPPPAADKRTLEEIYVRPKAETASGPNEVPGWTGPRIDRWLDRLSSPANANVALTLAEAANETPEC